jgi:teichuronic acid biosynthesis glycosyltransferase TuaC
VHIVKPAIKLMTEHATLKVLAVTSIFPNSTAPNLGIYNACALEQLAHVANLRVISPIKWCPGLSLFSKAERELSTIDVTCEYNGIPVSHPRFFRTPGFGRKWHGWMYEVSLRKHFEKAIREFRPDVLLAICAHPDGVAVQHIGERLGIPVVIKCMGSDIHELLGKDPRGVQVLEALKRCTRVVTVSDGLIRPVVEQGVPPGKIDVIYNGVDRQAFRAMPRSDARRSLKLPQYGKMILCIGNLVPVKCHCDLLDAFNILHREHEIEASLVILGDGPLREKLQEQARTLQIAHHVRFVGSCKHDQVPLWINASDTVCLASSNEGLPNVLREALSCGRPVVATDVGGVAELVSSPAYGRLVPAGDTAGMAQALNEVLGRAWDPQELAACPHVISWQQSARKLFEVLQRASPVRSAIYPAHGLQHNQQ